jgi:hypothetical protein
LKDIFVLNSSSISLLLEFIELTLLFIIHIIISFNHKYINDYITTDETTFDIENINIDLEVIFEELFNISSNNCLFIDNILVKYYFFYKDPKMNPEFTDISMLDIPEELPVEKIYFIHANTILKKERGNRLEHFYIIISEFNKIIFNKLKELEDLIREKIISLEQKIKLETDEPIKNKNILIENLKYIKFRNDDII